MFDGIHAVLYALFTPDETLDLAAMRTQVAHVTARGVHGITVLGLATEVGKLTVPEREALVAAVAEANAGRLPLSVTIAGNSVAEQVALARFAARAGADWLILQPPAAGAYPASVYLDFTARVAEAIDLPVAIQNAPQYLGRALAPADVAALQARCPNLAAIKAEDAALGLAALAEAAPGLALLGGRGGLEMTDALRLGARGFVLAPEFAPRAARIWRLWQDGDTLAAERLYAESLPAVVFAMQSLEHLITYGKRMFAAQAGLCVHDRAPCLPATAAGVELASRWAATLAETPA